MADKELLQCPFCGNERISKRVHNGDFGEIGIVGCGRCCGQVRSFGGLKKAVEIWNSRAECGKGEG